MGLLKGYNTKTSYHSLDNPQTKLQSKSTPTLFKSRGALNVDIKLYTMFSRLSTGPRICPGPVDGDK